MNDEQPSEFSLKNMPDVAQEVGFLVMVAANLDSWMLPAIGHMLRGRQEVAEAIMTRVDSISAKFDIMADIAKSREGTPLANKILEHESSARKAIGFRNKIAHGLYGFDDDKRPILVPFPLSKKRGKVKPLHVSPEVIRFHTDNLGHMIEAIVSVVGQAYFLSELQPSASR